MATIRDAGITGDFRHEHLEDPENEIRLVRVQPSDDKDDEIICTVSTYNICKAPPYVAISYTWGDGSRKRMLQINGRQISVGYNSWLVLWQARLHSIPHSLWIDIISIDQLNDFEKSIQVGRMGPIYRAANYVFASVGPHGDDSELLAEHSHAQSVYIELRRKERGQLDDRPLELLTCVICGGLPKRSTWRCKKDCESIRYCETCAHHADRDEVLENGSSVRIMDHGHLLCDFCRRAMTRRYYDCPERKVLLCISCAQPVIDRLLSERTTASDGPTLVLMDDWGDVNQPASLSNPHIQDIWQTMVRLFELPLEVHQRLVVAFRAFSVRLYFTRVWIIQEIMKARSVVLACGNSLLNFDELASLRSDYHREPEDNIYQSRHAAVWKDQQTLSWYLSTLISNGHGEDPSIWDLATWYDASSCSDSRDRVFGLLSLAKEPVSGAIRPDYTKSETQVLLQLLDQEARYRTHASKMLPAHKCVEMVEAFNIIGAFRSSPDTPEIKTMLGERRDKSRTDFVASRRAMQTRINDRRRIAVNVYSYCKIRRDHAGVWTAPLTKETRSASLPDDQLRMDHDIPKGAIHIRDIIGNVLAIAVGETQSGDTMLFLSDTKHYPTGLMAPAAGIIVREVQDGNYAIIGQVIFDVSLRPCPLAQTGNPGSCHSPRSSEDLTCMCKGDAELHSGRLAGWKVFMAPEDLLLFVAQDLKSVERAPEKGAGPIVDHSRRPEETARRLSTSIIYEPFSSYAVCETL